MTECGGSSVFRQKGPSLWGKNFKGNKRIERTVRDLGWEGGSRRI